MTSSLDTALTYISRGWAPVPIPHRAKVPRGDGWQTSRIDALSAPQHFNCEPANVGVLLGSASDGLTDVDLDCREAIEIAPYILPKTGAIFGRASKRGSHRLYITDLAKHIDNAAIQLKDPKSKGMLIELRIGGGGKGAQTVFPGSVHESGEPIFWEEGGEPAHIDGGELKRCVHMTAACMLMARYWPAEGSRHDTARVIGGFLARAGNGNVQIKLATEAIAKAAGDPEWRDRRKAAEDAARAHQEGKRTYGLSAMREMFGQGIADRIAEWLDYRGGDDAPRDEAQPAPNTTLESIRASTVKMAAIQWLWPDRFAIGKLGLLVGLPDEGKGQIIADMTGRVTRGDLWPCGEGPSRQRRPLVRGGRQQRHHRAPAARGRRRPRPCRDRPHDPRAGQAAHAQPCHRSPAAAPEDNHRRRRQACS
jgi:hypothetical protein